MAKLNTSERYDIVNSVLKGSVLREQEEVHEEEKNNSASKLN